MSMTINGKIYPVIALIPARGGSKRLPRKNIAQLAGKPLITWTIEMARDLPEIDRVAVSTDDAEIAGVAKSCGVEIIHRPGALAEDSSSAAGVIRDAIEWLQKDGEDKTFLVYLQPTSPLRDKVDITACLELLTSGYDAAATFTEASLHPQQAWRIDGNMPSIYLPGAEPWLEAQCLDHAFQLNGAVYAFQADRFPDKGSAVLFGRCGAVLMPKERSVDIDDPLDFMLAELLMARRNSVSEGAKIDVRRH